MNTNIFGKHVSSIVKKFAAISNKGDALDIGCANGETTLYLNGLGFNCIGIDKELPENLTQNYFHKIDVLDFKLSNYDFVVAINVIQFLSNKQKYKLLEEIINSLNVNGILVLSSFTILDDGFKICKERKIQEVETNCFWMPRMIAYMSFFETNELLNWVKNQNVELLHYEEFTTTETHEPFGEHIHGSVDMVIRKGCKNWKTNL